jgi:hypothetical protein
MVVAPACNMADMQDFMKEPEGFGIQLGQFTQAMLKRFVGSVSTQEGIG